MELERHIDDFATRDWEVPDTDDTVRFALVGIGWWTTEYVAPIVAESDLCEATVFVTSSPDDVAEAAAEFGVEHAIDYDEFRDGVAADEYDAVYVSTPNGTHLDYVEAAAALGKHVLCEKPLEVSGERAERMVAACEDAGVTFATAYRMQAEPGIRWLRGVIQDGVVGDPVYAVGDYSFTLLLEEGDEDQWRLNPAMAGGGPMMDIGVYPLNTLRYLLGADPVSVSATTMHRDERFDVDGVEETISFQLTFPGPVTGTFTCSYGASRDDRFTLVGTEGKVTVEPGFHPMRQRTYTIDRGDKDIVRTGREVALGGPAPHGLVELYDYFSACVLTDTTPDPDGRDGAVDCRVIDALYESAETGRRVDL
jgi:xylose dehydrogenase (NAD/NADP)